MKHIKKILPKVLDDLQARYEKAYKMRQKKARKSIFAFNKKEALKGWLNG